MKAIEAKRLTVFTIVVLALLPVCVLTVGRPGDDFQFHMSSWVEILEGWRSGVMRPGWASHANYNLGEPRFVFYPPLATMLGAVLLAVVPKLAIAQVYVWVVMVVAGCSMLALAKDLLPANDRLKAVALYMTSYYVLVAALLRFAAAELLTAALVPVVVLFYLRVMKGGGVRMCAGLSVALAGTWLTDAPAGVVVFYVLLLTTVVDAGMRRTVRGLVMFGAAEAGAVLLSAWYLLPAMAQKGQIAAASLLHFPRQNFMLFHQPPNRLTPAMLLPLWLWVVVGTALAVVLTWRELRAGHGWSDLRYEGGLDIRLLCLMAIMGMFCQTQASGLLWKFAPQFGYVAFAFRFDLFLGCVLPVVVLRCAPSVWGRRVVYAVWGVFLLVPFATKVQQQRTRTGWMSMRGFAAGVADGYPGYAEYHTANVPVPAAEVVSGQKITAAVGGGDCVAVERRWQPERQDFASASGGECVYRVALTYYPDWHVWVDGVVVERVTAGPDGTARVRVPAGKHEVSLRFVRPAAANVAGEVVSGMSLLLLLGIWVAGKRRRGVRSRVRQSEAIRI